LSVYADPRDPPSFPTRRSSDLRVVNRQLPRFEDYIVESADFVAATSKGDGRPEPTALDRITDKRWQHSVAPAQQENFGCTRISRSEEHTSELQSRENLVCRLLL